MTTPAETIVHLRTQVAGREKNIEQMHAEIGRLRLHVEGLQNTTDDYLGEKQQLAEWLDKAYADLETERSGRCPNCDHRAGFHSAGGCWFTLATGKPDANLVCPCAVVKP